MWVQVRLKWVPQGKITWLELIGYWGYFYHCSLGVWKRLILAGDFRKQLNCSKKLVVKIKDTKSKHRRWYVLVGQDARVSSGDFSILRRTWKSNFQFNQRKDGLRWYSCKITRITLLWIASCIITLRRWWGLSLWHALRNKEKL